MLDTSAGTAPALNHMRAAVAGFLDALPPDDEVVLITTGRQVRVRLGPTTDRQEAEGHWPPACSTTAAARC